MWYRVTGEVERLRRGEGCDECLVRDSVAVDEVVWGEDEEDAAQALLQQMWGGDVESAWWGSEPSVEVVPEDVMMRRLGVEPMF